MMGKRGYTVWEMILIVFVLGFMAWLAATKLSHMRAVARDAGRIADVAELTNALTAYYLDFNDYPTPGAACVDDTIPLVPSYLLQIPKDPLRKTLIDDFQNSNCSPGYYAYMPDRNKRRGSILVMAKIETPEKANYISNTNTLDPYTIDRPIIQASLCSDGITLDPDYDVTQSPIDPCITNDADTLRYVFIKYNE